MTQAIKIKLLMVIAIILILTSNGWGERNIGIGTSAQVDLDLRLEISSYLSLQIGSPGTYVDTVIFNVTDIPENQPFVKGEYQPPIQITTNMGKGVGINLTADSTVGLLGKSGKMPFSVISWIGTGDLYGSKGNFDGTANQPMIRISGKGKREGTFKFIYRNTYDYPPGTYAGTITFTLSSP